MSPLVTTQHHEPLSRVLGAAENLGLPILRSSYGTYHYTHVQLGTVAVPAYPEPRWRDLGEGPSWQEQYVLEQDLPAVPILWEPSDQFPGYAVTVTYPVVSLLRQGGAKLFGVSVAVNDDTTRRDSTHTHATYDYDAFRQLAGGTLFDFTATLADSVSFREIPYTHRPSKTHFVLDLG